MLLAARNRCGWLGIGIVVSCFAASSAYAQSNGGPVDRFWSLYNAGRYAEAEQTALGMLALQQRSRNAAGIGIASLMLGRATEKLERYDQAEHYYRDALKHLLTKDAAPLVTQTTYSLAWLLKTQGRWSEAAKLYQDYLARVEAEHGRDSAELVAPLTELADSHIHQLEFDQAEQLLARARNIAERQSPPLDYQAACIVRTLGLLRGRQRRLGDSEQVLRQALGQFERIQSSDGIAVASEDLALLLYPESRYQEAEEFAARALKLRLEEFGAEHSSTANVQNSLGRIYARQGRLVEAEKLLRQALATRMSTLGPEHPKVAVSLVDLADVLAAQSRFADAAGLLLRSLEIDEKIWGDDHKTLLPTLASLGYVLLQLNRLDEAVDAANRSLRILGPDNTAAGPGHAALGQIHLQRKDFAAAEQAYQRAIALNERFVRETGNPYRRTTAPAIRGLARVYYATKRYDLAQAKFDEVVNALNKDSGAGSKLSVALWERGLNHWAKGSIPAAIEDLSAAMDLAEQMRSNYSGTDADRSASFMNATVVFEDMVRLQAQTGDVAVALNAMERARNQSLLDQLSVHGIDLLAGIPSPQRAELERRRAGAATRTATAEQQLESLLSDAKLPADQRQHRSARIEQELNTARAEFVAIEASIRDASPAYRLAVSERHEPVTLGQLQGFVAQRKGLLLRYLVGDQASFVLVVPASGKSTLIELIVSDSQGRSLGIEPGPLDERKLAEALHNEHKSGVLQLLRESDQPGVERALESKLAVLWNLLVPPAVQESLEGRGLDRLMIVPDGDLAMLPFEALVTSEAGGAKYLLEAGPPIVYGPSATILYNLATQSAAGGASRMNVLTVGDPSYDAAATGSSRTATSTVHRAVVGPLGRLPYSGLEANWIEQTFTKAGASVTKLLGPAASEGAIRQQLASKQFVHFACHGLVDPQYGNLFGALAVAPGNRGGAGPLDDGFLSLAEIYQLDMRGTELTILSACDTNVGPGQIGEGVWALSRGFLVAGSRRVLASNWVVDDRAGATLISYYANLLSRGSDAKERDYARSLHAAKLLLRNDDRWRSPFYWSSLVLVGPN